MRTVRFRPKDFAVEPTAFGRVKAILWKKPVLAPGASAPGGESDDERRKRERANLERPRDEVVRLHAAQMQHAYVLRIRARIKATNGNLTTYARKSGAAYDHLNKVTRGDSVMTLEDIARAELELGEIHTFGPQVRTAVPR